MSDQGFFTVKNWAKYQHYKDRNPPWVKLHIETLASADWVTLADPARVLMVVCMIVASKNAGQVPNNPSYLQRLAYLNEPPDFKPLVDSGFLLDPQGLLASARPEAEAEAEDPLSSLRSDNGDTDEITPGDFKAQVMGVWRIWLMDASGREDRATRAVLGRWCKFYGDIPTIAALQVTKRNGAVEPISYTEQLLKGTARGSADDDYRAAAAALARSVGVDPMADQRQPGAATDRTAHNGYYDAVGGDGPGDGSPVRGGASQADRMGGGVRHPGPEVAGRSGGPPAPAKRDDGDLQGSLGFAAPRFTRARDLANPNRLDMAKPPAPGEHHPTGPNGNGSAPVTVDAGAIRIAESAGPGATQDAGSAGALARAAADHVARGLSADFEPIPECLRRH